MPSVLTAWWWLAPYWMVSTSWLWLNTRMSQIGTGEVGVSRLDKLRKSLEDMSSEEQYNLIRHIRADRKLVKERPADRVRAARNKEKAKTTLGALLEGMSDAEIAALLGELDDAGEGNTA